MKCIEFWNWITNLYFSWLELIRKDGAGPLFDFLAEFGGINTEEISVADDQNATEKDMTIIFRKLYMASDAPIFVGILPTNEHIRVICSI